MFVLLQHPSSWVMFNLAALYYRVEGSAYHALGCLRGALHHAPRDKKVSELCILEPKLATSDGQILVMYNFAAFYWHEEGHASEALNYLRGGLHFSQDKKVSVHIMLWVVRSALHHAPQDKR